MITLADPAATDPALADGERVLQVEELKVLLGKVCPVDGVSFEVRAGETFALLGESGCGKSMTALALMRLLPDVGRIDGGSVRFRGEELLARSEAAMREVRGGRMGMIFQLSGGMKQRVMIAMALAGEPELLIADEPTTALDVTIQAQVLDLLAGLQRSRRMGMLLITHDLGVVARMAHQVGVMYAGELVERGARAQFFANPLHPYSRKLFAALPAENLRGFELETLDGSVPALDQAFAGCRFAPRCPQAHARCESEAPAWHRIDGQQVRCHLFADGHADWARTPPVASQADRAVGAQPVLEVDALQVHFPIRKGVFKRVVGQVRAVDGVDLTLHPGRTLALVGESGCGKTTVGKAILQLVKPTGGSVRFAGAELAGLAGKQMKPHRRGLQMVFQDPFASLNPRMRVGQIIEEGMDALGVGADAAERRALIDALLARVGLSADMRDRYPHAFSGGQRQRIAIARALAVSPQLIVCDEPTSALDVSVQAQILNLLRELQREMGLAYLFITHNIAVVDYLAHDVAVMYLGRIVESGPAEALLARPAHPYTRALLDAVPRIDAADERRADEAGEVGGELPSPIRPPSGCHFHPRCPRAEAVCRSEYPTPAERGAGHMVRCHFPLAAKVSAN